MMKGDDSSNVLSTFCTTIEEDLGNRVVTKSSSFGVNINTNWNIKNFLAVFRLEVGGLAAAGDEHFSLGSAIIHIGFFSDAAEMTA